LFSWFFHGANVLTAVLVDNSDRSAEDDHPDLARRAAHAAIPDPANPSDTIPTVPNHSPPHAAPAACPNDIMDAFSASATGSRLGSARAMSPWMIGIRAGQPSEDRPTQGKSRGERGRQRPGLRDGHTEITAQRREVTRIHKGFCSHRERRESQKHEMTRYQFHIRDQSFRGLPSAD